MRNVVVRSEIQRLLPAALRLALRAGYYGGLLPALRWLHPPEHRGLLILMYHSVGNSDLLHSGLRVSERNFVRQLEHLTRHCEILPLERAVGMMRRAEPLPENAVSLTFDDGFRDNYETAFPLLRKYRCPATIFVATGPVANKRSLWPYRLIFWMKKTTADRLEFSSERAGPAVFDLRTGRRRSRTCAAIEAALWRVAPQERERLLSEVGEKLGFGPEGDPFDELPMLTWEQLREMADAGVEIGSHTVSHPALSALSREEARRELAESKKHLEAELGRPVKLFAYPFGGPEHFNSESRNLVRECGYEAACSTIAGINHSGTDPLALLRVAVQDDPPAIFAFKLSRFS